MRIKTSGCPSLHEYQYRVANIAIGSTALRNQGASGVNESARGFLSRLRLALLVRQTEAEFLTQLDQQTRALMNALPPQAQHWGTARKALNLFLGEVYYHRVLSTAYRLGRIARFLEVPLDSQVAHFLRERAKDSNKFLPRWTTIKALTPQSSRQYQEFAMQCAKTRGNHWIRLHIDLVAWRPVLTAREPNRV